MPKTENPWRTRHERYARRGAVLFPRLVHVLDPEPHRAAWNMALDEVLLATVSVPTIRIYRWRTPSVSFGYFGRSAEVTARWPGREATRRWTGGGVVLHGEDLTYSLVVPRDHAFASESPGASYRAIHQALATWLGARGVDAALSGGEGAATGECFAGAVAHDVVAAGGKIAGGAQRRTRQGLLHQGSIQGVALTDAARAELPSAFSPEITPRALTTAEIEAAERLERDKYGTEVWFRRW